MQYEALLHNGVLPAELLPGIAAFAQVARHGSFTKAAAQMGVSPSALSQTLRNFEARLGVRLLERSTRRVGVTEIGQRFLHQAQPGLAALASAIEDVNELRDKPTGLLRLNLSRTAADILLMPHLLAFIDTYPDITVEIHCDNALLDVVAGGFDAGIRVGENLAQDVVAVPLGGPHRIATVAAPSYLLGREHPRKPEDLDQHRCLNIRLTGAIYRWDYNHKGQAVAFQPRGPLITNDVDTLMQAIRAGAGIGCAFEAQVQPDIDSGKLVPLLGPWWPSVSAFYLYYPSRIHVPRKLRVFIEFMQNCWNR
ncbi:LysR family transcriptional regulator [Pseudomonas sp. 10B1]|uniref:LysR family transcriptional regulator n=1 Tax=unclassified Pseudomonas TaxID=196821 RepID=UPI002AB4DE63|nr:MULTISPECIES: LysR family transcriptional regulator [unclassified Pseudomonas]MDY7559819.1 LysR family transcriptional regulator [Pseudomonas sp. AB6]MEA9992944.1 LysR family transcriptional regulator [Pseudomonas sp. AA4]MEB0085887.1 LysR family transcriptional regulator [Pseudomonas sp. RTI1]MEB0125678.1 LysR family transcriptional regulator [Pseudomonas sp. CCC1.2]MEB0151529.1 LysR family transcriptional regulator [Pseudomonas sp. CCC4.3]